jgi:hypothetical protein
VNKWRKSGQYLISTRRAILKHPVWILEGVIRSTLAIENAIKRLGYCNCCCHQSNCHLHKIQKEKLVYLDSRKMVLVTVCTINVKDPENFLQHSDIKAVNSDYLGSAQESWVFFLALCSCILIPSEGILCEFCSPLFASFYYLLVPIVSIFVVRSTQFRGTQFEVQKQLVFMF